MSLPLDPPSHPSCIQSLFLTPGERRLRAGFRLFGQFAILVALFFCLGGALAAVYYFSPEFSDVAFTALSQVITVIAVTLSVFLARRWLDRRSFVSLGLNLRARAGLDILAGFGIAGLMMVLIFLIEWSAGWLTFDGPPLGAGGLLQKATPVVGMVLVFTGVGWGEELLYRGYQLQNLEEGANLTWGVLLSSIFFALGHLANPNVSLAAVLGLVASGIFLAYGYTSTRQLWLPMGLHIGWNFFEGTVFGFPVSGIGDFPRLLQPAISGPALVTGGAFGPEAGLVLLPALGLGAALVYLYTRRRMPGVSENSMGKQ
jgi:hypothetical protein